MTSPALIWPDKHACHKGEPNSRLSGGIWRAPNPHSNQETGDFDDRAYRTCDYCGSIHPQDLWAYLTNPELKITLESADWKYGWPHKFYVEGIPSPLRGQRVARSKTWNGSKMVIAPRDWSVEPDTAMSHAKFYTQHLVDLDDASFAAIARFIWKQTRIVCYKNKAQNGLLNFFVRDWDEVRASPDSYFIIQPTES